MTDKTKSASEGEKNLHKDHRKRVYSRYEKTGFEGFAEHGILEMMLFASIPRADTNETAHLLINRFGSLYNVLTAPMSELVKVKGVGKASAMMLVSTFDAIRNANIAKIAAKPITRYEQLYRLATEWFGGKPAGTVALLFLNKSGMMLDTVTIASREHFSPESFPEEVLMQSVKAGAAGVVLMHNHHDGIMAPSAEDIVLTAEIYALLKKNGIRLMEHMIVHELDAVPVLEKCVSGAVSAFPYVHP